MRRDADRNRGTRSPVDLRVAGAAVLLGPWMSFPSVFLLGGASAALLLHRLERLMRAGWLGWTAFNAAVAASGCAAPVGLRAIHVLSGNDRALGP